MVWVCYIVFDDPESSLLYLRMRLECFFANESKQAMNEVIVHRGIHPHLLSVQCKVDDCELTNFIVF